MKTVLIAEDEVSIREFININLRLAGYDIIEACDGKDAIEKYNIHKNKIDIAVLDIMMPECDGVEVCKYIRNDNPNVGIIFLTAKTQEHDKVNGLISGADDYITKPFSTTELIARVEALYRRVDFSKNLIICLIIGLVIGLIVVLVLKGQLKSVHQQHLAHDYVKEGSMNLTIQRDMFLYRNVTRTKRESSGSSGSGGGSSRNVGGGSF